MRGFLTEFKNIFFFFLNFLNFLGNVIYDLGNTRLP